MEKKFSIQQALSFGFSSFLDNIILFISAQLIGILVIVAAGGIHLAVATAWPSLGQLTFLPLLEIGTLAFITLYILYGLYLGVVRMYLDIYETGTSSLKRLFSYFHLVPKVAVASFLYRILMLCAAIALFFPVFFVAAYYGFFRFDLVEKNSGIGKAFASSARLAGGSVSNLALFYFIKFLLLLPGVISINLIRLASTKMTLWLLALPFLLFAQTILYVSLSLATAFVYKELQKQTLTQKLADIKQ